MKAFKQIFLSQTRIFTRERVTLIVTFIMPILVGTFLSLLFTGMDTKTIRIHIVDQDRADLVRKTIDELKEGTKGTQLVVKESGFEEAMTLLASKRTDGILVFPKGSEMSIMGMKPSKLPLYYHPSKMESAAIARLVLREIVVRLNIQIAKVDSVLEVEEHPIAKDNASMANFYFPNFLAISLLWQCLFATAMPLVKQRESHTLQQMRATPLSPFIFMMGSISSRLMIGLIQSVLFLGVGFFTLKLYHIKLLPLFFLGVILGNLCFIFMGYMIAAISKSIQNANGIVQLVNFGMMFLSGVFFKGSMLPAFLYKLSYIFPLTYLADLFRQLMAGYEGMFPLWLNFAVLIAYGAVFATISLKFFKLFQRTA
jgi:ABC-2 type transport system permease protein